MSAAPRSLRGVGVGLSLARDIGIGFGDHDTLNLLDAAGAVWFGGTAYFPRARRLSTRYERDELATCRRARFRIANLGHDAVEPTQAICCGTKTAAAAARCRRVTQSSSVLRIDCAPIQNFPDIVLKGASRLRAERSSSWRERQMAFGASVTLSGNNHRQRQLVSAFGFCRVHKGDLICVSYALRTAQCGYDRQSRQRLSAA